MVTVNITLTPQQVDLLTRILDQIDRDLIYTGTDDYEMHRQLESILEDAENEITSQY
jgi:hypothetical protein